MCIITHGAPHGWLTSITIAKTSHHHTQKQPRPQKDANVIQNLLDHLCKKIKIINVFLWVVQRSVICTEGGRRKKLSVCCVVWRRLSTPADAYDALTLFFLKSWGRGTNTQTRNNKCSTKSEASSATRRTNVSHPSKLYPSYALFLQAFPKPCGYESHMNFM